MPQRTADSIFNGTTERAMEAVREAVGLMGKYKIEESTPFSLKAYRRVGLERKSEGVSFFILAEDSDGVTKLHLEGRKGGLGPIQASFLEKEIRRFLEIVSVFDYGTAQARDVNDNNSNMRSEKSAPARPESPEALFCPECGSGPQADAKFCMSCGTPLRAGAPVASRSSTTPGYGPGRWEYRDFTAPLGNVKFKGQGIPGDGGIPRDFVPLVDVAIKALLSRISDDGWQPIASPSADTLWRDRCIETDWKWATWSGSGIVHLKSE
jgi:hypothetical protein